MPIDTELEKLIINKNISKSQFIEAYENGLIGDNDLSFVDDNTEYDIIVDDVMSDTSENAVQNKVIKAYVDTTKQDKLISGTNIKTINGENVIGNGDLDIKNSISVGIVLPFAGSTAPSGFLICDGSAISRTTYADLFKVIGTTYGTGNGSTTFNLPNYSSARFVTSSTVAVRGDGNTLGLMGYSSSSATSYSGYGLIKGNHETWGKLIVSSGAYGTKAGSGGTVSGNKPVDNTTLGLANDASKTGVTGTASLASSCKFIIKY